MSFSLGPNSGISLGKFRFNILRKGSFMSYIVCVSPVSTF